MYVLKTISLPSNHARLNYVQYMYIKQFMNIKVTMHDEAAIPLTCDT